MVADSSTSSVVDAAAPSLQHSVTKHMSDKTVSQPRSSSSRKRQNSSDVGDALAKTQQTPGSRRLVAVAAVVPSGVLESEDFESSAAVQSSSSRRIDPAGASAERHEAYGDARQSRSDQIVDAIHKSINPETAAALSHVHNDTDSATAAVPSSSRHSVDMHHVSNSAVPGRHDASNTATRARQSSLQDSENDESVHYDSNTAATTDDADAILSNREYRQQHEEALQSSNHAPTAARQNQSRYSEDMHHESSGAITTTRQNQFYHSQDGSVVDGVKNTSSAGVTAALRNRQSQSHYSEDTHHESNSAATAGRQNWSRYSEDDSIVDDVEHNTSAVVIAGLRSRRASLDHIVDVHHQSNTDAAAAAIAAGGDGATLSNSQYKQQCEKSAHAPGSRIDQQQIAPSAAEMQSIAQHEPSVHANNSNHSSRASVRLG